MALENCFQMSAVFTTSAANRIQCYHPFFSVKDLHMSTVAPFSKPSFSFAKSRLSFLQKTRNARIACKAGEAVDQVKPANDATWETLVIASQTPVLVEFWAPWCGPCKMIQPVIDDLAKEYTGKISCYKVNTDDSPGIASKYGIRSIPTILFFKNGQKKEGIIGAVQKKTLADAIDKYVE